MKIKSFNVIDQSDLPEITVGNLPSEGDPLEIEGEIYYVCEIDDAGTESSGKIGVIPLIVKNPARVKNIGTYIKCLSTAHRRIQFRKKNNSCDMNECDEMIIS